MGWRLVNERNVCSTAASLEEAEAKSCVAACRAAVMVLDSGILVAGTAQETSLSEELRVYEMVRPSAWPHEKQMHNNRSSGTSVFSLRFISSVDTNSWQHLSLATLLSSARVASRVERSAGSILCESHTARKYQKPRLRL